MTSALFTLLAYALVLLSIGIWASYRSTDATDYLLAGRSLGPWVAGLSASASSSSAWTLLGVSGAAYFWGLAALWLLPATLGGFLINWYWVAPRLRRLSHETGALTLCEVIASPSLGRSQRAVARLIAAITLFCFVFYIASQFEGAAGAFGVYFDVPRAVGIVLGVTVVFAYTVLGGFWAASVSDTLQGITMVAAAILLPVAGIIALGGPVEFATVVGEARVGDPALFGSQAGWLSSIGFVIGTLGIGLGYPGQPHVVNRFMALRDNSSLRQGRRIAIAWALIIYTGMLLAGLCARVVLDDTAGNDSHVLFEYARAVLPPAVAAVVLAAVLSAIMSTADSQLLVAASSVSHDWHIGAKRPSGTSSTRIVVALLCAAAAVLALYLPADIFSRVLFAWHALGSALGPLLLMRLSGYDVSVRMTFLSILSGFLLTVLFNGFANLPGDWLERLVPLLASSLFAWAGRQR